MRAVLLVLAGALLAPAGGCADAPIDEQAGRLLSLPGTDGGAALVASADAEGASDLRLDAGVDRSAGDTAADGR